MSATSLSVKGLAALENRQWDEAIQLLTQAIDQSQSPAWLLARARAYDNVKKIDNGLEDAALAYHVAAKRGNDKSRKQMIEAQYRRAVLYYKKRQLANADCCAVWSQRLAKGQSASAADDVASNIDGQGDYKATLKEAENEQFKDQDPTAGKNIASAMSKDKSGYEADWNKAQMWRLRVLADLEELPPNHDGRKVTVQRVPKNKNIKENVKTSKPIVTTPAVGGAVSKATQFASTSSPIPAAAPIPTKAKLEASGQKFRNQSYQSDTTMSVTLFMRFLQAEDAHGLKVEFKPGLIIMSGVPREPSTTYLVPFAAIDPDKSSFRSAAMKVELKLHKVSPGKWAAWGREELERPDTADMPGVDATSPVKGAKSTALQTPAIISPYVGAKDWDKLVPEVVEAQDDKDPNEFFKTLYKNADPEVQRAMMKSYTESNGTALSTSWAEAKDKTYETSPPSDVVAKKW